MECRSFCPGFEGIGKCWNNRQFIVLFRVDLGGKAPPPSFWILSKEGTCNLQYHLSSDSYVLFFHPSDSFTKLASSDSGVGLS